MENLGIPRLDIENDYSYYPITASGGELHKADAAVRRIYNEHLADLWDSLPGGLVHADIRRSNILVKGEKITGIIDFEDLRTRHSPFVWPGLSGMCTKQAVVTWSR
jgi:Ser/Thr protein kinase RdoA (MazF antagonist)